MPAVNVGGIGAEHWKGTPTMLGKTPGPAQRPFLGTGFNGIWQEMPGDKYEGRPIYALGVARMYVGRGKHWMMCLDGDGGMKNNEPPFNKGGLVRSGGPSGPTLLPHQVAAPSPLRTFRSRGAIVRVRGLIQH